MRNLSLTYHLFTHDKQLEAAQCICVDGDTRSLYFCDSDGIKKCNLERKEVSPCVSLLAEGYFTDSHDVAVMGMTYVLDQQSVCIATSCGDVLLFSTVIQEVECVGTVDSGLLNMEWSPDQEIVSFVSGVGTAILMTRDFEPIIEVELHQEGFGESKLITVGWGKKETQFHGSEGKMAAKEVQHPVKPVFPWDDRRPRISWRGDGQFFVVSLVMVDTEIRHLRIFNREGILQYTSEDVVGLEQSLSWKPSGSLIATSVRTPNKHHIAFFEKNGLRHGEFTMPFTPTQIKVREVMWNVDSSVLLVWCEDLPAEGSSSYVMSTYIQLWSVNNCHWYLKQNMRFGPGNSVRALLWDTENSLRLHVVCSDGKYIQYNWCWNVCHSSGVAEKDVSCVAVIDGDKVLMTPFRETIVPPPMCAYQLLLPAFVSEVVFPPSVMPKKVEDESCSPAVVADDSGFVEESDYSSWTSNSVMVVLSDMRLAVFTTATPHKVQSTCDGTVKITGVGGNGFQTKVLVHCLFGICDSDWILDSSVAETVPLNCHNWTWAAGDIVLCSCSTDEAWSLCVLQLQHTEAGSPKVTLKSMFPVKQPLLRISTSQDGSIVAVILRDGTVLQYNVINNVMIPWNDSRTRQALKMPQPLSQIEICDIAGDYKIFGRTDGCRFYVGDKEVASNCTSFTVHSEFLLLSTFQHTVRCIPLVKEAVDSLTSDQPVTLDESNRRIERGARLVCAVPRDTRVILQMPRGNLETIHPRALVLHVVSGYLDSGRYCEALDLMRKHRINLNILFDHCPTSFLENIATVLQKISDPNLISLFLSELIEEDVTEGMYSAAYSRKEVKDKPLWTSKIDTICDAVRKVLDEQDPDRYLLPILTSYVKKTIPELDAALKRIKEVRDDRMQAHTVTAEEALKYLIYHVDVNELYRVALGTYDFDLVIMVAGKTQEDPKEYLPFLNDLHKLETNYQRYTIDKHLKRFGSALKHISLCGEEHFAECLSFVRTHKLYLEAMTLFPRMSNQYMEICVAYGECLESQKLYEDAGIMYSHCQSNDKALDAFKKAGNWRQCLCMASKLHFSAEDMRKLCHFLVEFLKENCNHTEAAIILDQYLGDMEEGIASLIEGHSWEEALRLMYQHNRLDIIETHLKPSVLEYFETISGNIQQLSETFEKHRSRLVIVREQKQKEMLDVAEDDVNAADRDLYSDTSSTTGISATNSRMTGRMSRSGKYRRKLERKKYSLKEGSPYEDLALITSLYETITTADKLKDDVNQLSKVLFEFGFVDQARGIQMGLSDLLKRVDESKDEIWSADVTENRSTSAAVCYGPEATANSIAAMLQGKQNPVSPVNELEPHLRHPPTLKKEKHWELEVLKS